VSITRRRPGIPKSYGIDQDEDGMLDWNVVTAALVAAPVYWVASVKPDGGPHLIPIWGAWVKDAAFIEGGDDTRWARNLSRGDGRVHVSVDHDAVQVMVRGAATAIDVDAETRAEIADQYEAKYPYRPEGTRFWRVEPQAVLAWRVDTIESFAATPTQFDFATPA